MKSGDRMLFGKWSGTEVKIDGEELVIMKESDILGVIEGAPAAKVAGNTNKAASPATRGPRRPAASSTINKGETSKWLPRTCVSVVTPVRRMLAGIEMLANAVKVTLGPKGRNVVLDKSYGAPRITKDGVTVAKEIELADKFENMGAQMVREVASQDQRRGRRRHHHGDRAGPGHRARGRRRRLPPA